MAASSFANHANSAERGRAPANPIRVSTTWLAGFVAFTALLGAGELLGWPQGNPYLPLSLLSGTPFATFIVPGLLLGLIVGGSALAAAVASVRDSAWRVDATLLSGGTLSGWIACELALLRTFSWLHVVYGGLGLALLALGALQLTTTRELRQRWVAGLTLAESLGYLAPTLAGVLGAHWSADHHPVAWTLVVAGCIEGLCLGLGQAAILPWPVNKRGYVAATALAAGTVWAGVFVMMSSVGSGSLGVAQWLMLGLAALTMLFAIGGAQWFVLRRVVSGGWVWAAWTALAWLLALPLSFLPGPLVDETTPLSTHLVVWGSGGVLMAYVMAWFTWLGVRALQRRNPTPSRDLAA